MNHRIILEIKTNNLEQLKDTQQIIGSNALKIILEIERTIGDLIIPDCKFTDKIDYTSNEYIFESSHTISCNSDLSNVMRIYDKIIKKCTSIYQNNCDYYINYTII